MAESRANTGFEQDILLHEAGGIRVLIVNPDESTLEKLSHVSSLYPQIVIVGEARGVEETLIRINELRPHVVIMLAESGTPAVEYDDIASVCRAQGSCRLLVMAERPARYVGVAIKAGATALLSRDTAHHELVNTIYKTYFWSRCQPLPQ